MLALLLLCCTARADVYVLGSSYSNDARPAELDESPLWHIDCSKSLIYIYENPGFPCQTASTKWPGALTGNWFEYISFQPVEKAGSTFLTDFERIQHWISLQPFAVVVIHPTWPKQSIFEATYHDPSPDNSVTNYSPSYYDGLIATLQAANPGRAIISDRVNEMLDSIYHDIESDVGPLDDFEQMFRDEYGHSSNDYGKYLQHNALRQAFSQPTGVDTTGIDPAVKAYLDAKIAAFQPPATPTPPEQPVPSTLTIVEHIGGYSPSRDEGWTASEPPAWVPAAEAGHFGPIVDDGGVQTWVADDDSSTYLSGAFYTRELTPAERAQADSFGWRLSARLRIVDAPDPLEPESASNVVRYRNGWTSWEMRFGSEADGDPIVDLYSDAVGGFVEFTLQNGGAGYHLYELVYDPDSDSAELFVDGVLRQSGLTGRALVTAPSVRWGNAATADTGHANYELVRFALDGASVPALPPGALALLALAFATVAGRFARRRTPTIR